MRIQYMSDLHLEFHEGDIPFHIRDIDADVVVLAGDIGNCGSRYFDWVLKETQGRQALMIAGNHEGYATSWQRTIRKWKAALEGTHVHFLDDDCVVIDGVRFLGSTLWTDFMVFGPQSREQGILVAEARMNDYRLIRFEENGRFRKLRAADTMRMHNQTRRFLETNLSQAFDGQTVIITHHAPALDSVDEMYRSDVLTTAFAVDMTDMMHRYRPGYWIHGHLHNRVDKLIGETRVLCNARGYFPAELNPAFDPAACIEI